MVFVVACVKLLEVIACCHNGVIFILVCYLLQMWCCNVSGRVCLCVCAVCAVTLESLDLETSFWGAGTSSEYLGHIYMSRSLVQGQGHRSKRACLCVLFRF